MNPLLLLAALYSSQEAAPAEPAVKPAALVGAMLVRYREARTISGQWTFRQVATAPQEKAEITVTTAFAMERPGRVRIEQKSSRRSDKTYLYVSDGAQVTFDVPDLNAPKGLRQLGPVEVEPDGSIEPGRVIAGASRTIPDPFSPFFIAAASWTPALETWRGQWVSLVDGGRGEVDGAACRIVKGKWRSIQAEPSTGTFGLWITDAGDLLRYRYEQTLNPVDESGKALGQVTILSDWTGALTLNLALPADTFKLVP